MITGNVTPIRGLIQMRVTGEKWPVHLPDLAHRVYTIARYSHGNTVTFAELVEKCASVATQEQVLDAARKLRADGYVKFAVKGGDFGRSSRRGSVARAR